MTQFLEFIPILAFVIAYFFGGIFWATGALMIAVSLQLALMWLLGVPISSQLKLVFWASLIFGGLTLAYQDNAFIVWKPTVVNWLMAGVLLASQSVFKVNLLERLLGQQLALPGAVWSRLSVGWAAGFFIAGVLNLVVAFNFSEALWVSYRLFGGLGLTLLYVLITVGYLVAGGHLGESAADKADVKDGRTGS